VSRSFFVINISAVPLRFKKLSRARFCVDGTAAPCLAALSGQAPKARRVAPLLRREGLTAKARAKQQGVLPLRCKRSVLVDPLLRVEVPITFVQSIQGLRYAALAASTYIRSG
jgi:hypothetical protein